MTEYRKGDVCSLEVVVQDVRLSGDYGVMLLDAAGNTHMPIVSPTDLTLIRRAPVDLATCELPVEIEFAESGVRANLLATNGAFGWVDFGLDMQPGTVRLDSLRPADAPAPAGSTTGCYLSDLDHYLSQARDGEPDVRVSVQRLREWREAFNALYYGPRPSWAPKHDAPAPAAPPERIRVAQDAEGFWTCREAISGSPEYIRADLAPAPAAEAGEVERLRAIANKFLDYSDEEYVPNTLFDQLREALASNAPSCPPGHIMIGDRAVPEPMREAPATGEKFWMVAPNWPNMTYEATWNGSPNDLHRLNSGLAHITQANAIAHAEALIAPTKRRASHD